MVRKQLIAVFLFVSIHSFAQLNKNKMMISGRGNFYSQKTGGFNYINNIASPYDEKNIGGSAEINIGGFVTNNFAWGGILGLERNIQNWDQIYPAPSPSKMTRKTTTESFTTGLFARYNHMIAGSKLGLFFQFDNTYSWGRVNRESINEIPNYPPNGDLGLDKNFTFGLNLKPGLMYYITNKLSIESSIGNLYYNSTVEKDRPLENNTRKSSIFRADFSMATVYFGLTFYLGGNKNATTSSN